MGEKSFLLYDDFFDSLNKLTDEEAGRLIKAVFHYRRTDELPSLDPLVDMAITPLIAQMKRDAAKYAETCKKRSEAGRIGGIKSGKVRRSNSFTDEANEANAVRSKHAQPNEAENENEIENENEMENDNETEGSRSPPTEHGSESFDRDNLQTEIAGLVRSMKPTVAPKESPRATSPTDDEVKRALDDINRNPMLKDISQVVRFGFGSSGKDRPDIQAVLSHPDRETIIRDTAAYTHAWKVKNPDHSSDAPAVFTNQLKDRLNTA